MRRADQLAGTSGLTLAVPGPRALATMDSGAWPCSTQPTSARGPGTASVNPEVPASWSARRTRPLCPYPQVAVYTGGDAESAASFACRAPRTP